MNMRNQYFQFTIAIFIRRTLCCGHMYTISRCSFQTNGRTKTFGRELNKLAISLLNLHGPICIVLCTQKTLYSEGWSDFCLDTYSCFRWRRTLIWYRIAINFSGLVIKCLLNIYNVCVKGIKLHPHVQFIYQ